jgi:DNA-binding IclR family transcriptional regulator
VSATVRPVANRRVRGAIRARLRDSGGRHIRVPLSDLADELNLNSRETLRVLRHLEQLGLIDVHAQGGWIVVGPRTRAAA